MKYLAALFAVATLACGEPVFSPETEMPEWTFVIQLLEYRATEPMVTLRDAVPGQGRMTMQFGKNRTVLARGPLNFPRWGPSAAHPVGEPYLLLSDEEFVGTYKFTTSNTLEMSFPEATGANAWVNGTWFYNWDHVDKDAVASRAAAKSELEVSTPSSFCF